MQTKNVLLIRFGVLAMLGLAVLTAAIFGSNSNPVLFKADLSGMDIPIQDDSDAEHPDIAVMYKRNDPNYGDYYIAGKCGFAYEAEPVSGFYDNSIVHCPKGSEVKYHANQHTSHNPRLVLLCQRGFFDGKEHYWCEKDGLQINPVLGPDPELLMPPDRSNANAYLTKYTFPDENLKGVDYFKAHYYGTVRIPLTGWVTCEYGVDGPFLNDTDPPHYFCLSNDGSRFIDPIQAEGPAAPYNSDEIFQAAAYESGITAFAEEPDNIGSCPNDLYYCQTVDPALRFCSYWEDCSGNFDISKVDDELDDEVVAELLEEPEQGGGAKQTGETCQENSECESAWCILEKCSNARTNGETCLKDWQCENEYCNSANKCAFADENLRELEQQLTSKQIELSDLEEGTEEYEYLKGVVEDLEGFLEARKKRRLTRGARLFPVPVADASTNDASDTGDDDSRDIARSDPVSKIIQDRKALSEEFSNFVKEKSVNDLKAVSGLQNLQISLENVERAREKGDQAEIKRLMEHIDSVTVKTEEWLAKYGYKKQDLTYSEFLGVDDELALKAQNILENSRILFDEEMQNLALKLAGLSKNFSASFENRARIAMDNLGAIGNSSLRNNLAQSRIELLEQLAISDAQLSAVSLDTGLKERLRELMERVANVNWCGDNAVKVKQRFSFLFDDLAGFSEADLVEIESALPTDSENHDRCFETGVAHFKDVPVNEWYFAAAEYVYDKGFVRGYSDSTGERTGDLGSSDSTLRMEALAMGMRLFEIPQVGESNLWYEPYIKGAFENGITRDWDWTKPINRLETASLFLDLILSLDEDYITLPTGVLTAIERYPDRTLFDSDVEASQAVEVWTDLGVFQGSGSTGNFDPYSNLLRSEYVTIVKRIYEILNVLKAPVSVVG